MGINRVFCVALCLFLIMAVGFFLFWTTIDPFARRSHPSASSAVFLPAPFDPSPPLPPPPPLLSNGGKASNDDGGTYNSPDGGQPTVGAWGYSRELLRSLVGNVTDRGLQAVLIETHRQLSQSQLLEDTCHPLLHELGSECARPASPIWLSEAQVGAVSRGFLVICNGGFLHGYIITRLSVLTGVDSLTTPMATLRLSSGRPPLDVIRAQTVLLVDTVAEVSNALCEGPPPPPPTESPDAIKEPVISGGWMFQCMHGIGHAVFDVRWKMLAAAIDGNNPSASSSATGFYEPDTPADVPTTTAWLVDTHAANVDGSASVCRAVYAATGLDSPCLGNSSALNLPCDTPAAQVAALGTVELRAAHKQFCQIRGERCRAAEDNCLNGMLMEFYNSVPTGTGETFLERFSLSRCDQWPHSHADCCFYAAIAPLLVRPRRYADAAAWCAQQPDAYTKCCFDGVGMQLAKENMAEMDYVAAVCASVDTFYFGRLNASADARQDKLCFRSALGYARFATMGSLHSVCERLRAFPAERRVCHDYE